METIVIIGAGASGLACMNELLKENKYNIIILEQAKKAARKVLASGNGRCNVSNLNFLSFLSIFLLMCLSSSFFQFMIIVLISDIFLPDCASSGSRYLLFQ